MKQAPSGELFVGLNSGTSMDGIGAVLVRLDEPAPELLKTHHAAYPPALARRLREIVAGTPIPMAELAHLDAELGRLFAGTALELLAAAGVPAAAVRALGCHGQTVYHGPGDRPPVTLQLGDPNTVAERTGIDTVADLRRRDVAAGGQGAPLAPALHAALFRAAGEDRAVVNLGGVANVTLLPADPAQPVTGFDTGPGNCLMDAWIRECSGRPFDRDGAWAAASRVDPGMLEKLLADDYFARKPPKSTGVETLDLSWIRRRVALDEADPGDVQATLAELTAVTVADALRTALPGARRLIVCGGGARNIHLMERLGHHLGGVQVAPSDAFGLAAEWVEPVLFAYLARETVAGRALDLTATTGTAHPHLYGTVFFSGLGPTGRL